MAFFQNLFKSNNAGSSESVLERVRRGEVSNNLRGADDELVWFRDLEKHAFGKYSYAAVRVSDVAHKEQFSEVVPGPKAVFVGLYDGHNGAQASRFVSENLYPALLRRIKQRGSISGDDVEVAFDEVERGFMEEVDKVAAPHDPSMTIAGTSCLVAIVWNRQLLLATLGDSRAVLGIRQIGLQVRGRQLTTSDHILPRNVTKGDRYYCLKGLPNMRTTHALGDLYLKESRFNRNHNVNDPFNVGNKISYPLIQSTPEIVSEKIDGLVNNNRFVIIASKGFWQEFNTEEATELVAAQPKKGIARRLLVCAMERAAEGKMMRYDALKRIPAGEERSAIHEDMTVIVLFLDFFKFFKKPREDLLPTHAFQGRVANFNF